MKSYNGFPVPENGQAITFTDGKLVIPDNPVIPYIEGDGTGRDIWKATARVCDAAVEKSYGGKRRGAWFEGFAGEKAFRQFGEWLPKGTLDAITECHIAIKGPLTTPVGGGIRSLNVALRQLLNLYACWRPVKYIPGVPSPVRFPTKMNVIIFRENTEDVYAGIEWPANSPEAKKIIDFLIKEMKVTKIRFPNSAAIGIKPVSIEGSERLIRRAYQYAIDNKRRSVTLVHKGNIQKFTEGGFRDWGYKLAVREFGAKPIDGGPWHSFKNPTGGPDIVVKDVIMDAMLQQVLLRPAEYDVLATCNLNGDYISDALAAQMGGIGIAPGANLSDSVAMFEATHGTAPKYAGQDKVNPGSLILSAEMMLRHLGWAEAADLILGALGGAVATEAAHFGMHVTGVRASGAPHPACDEVIGAAALAGFYLALWLVFPDQLGLGEVRGRFVSRGPSCRCVIR